MKATIKGTDFVLNMEYFSSTDKDYAFFNVPADEMTAEVFSHLGGYVLNIRKATDDRYSVMIKADCIKWED